MYRGTTPTLIFRLIDTELDLTTIVQAWVTLKKTGTEKTWDINSLTFDNEEKTITLSLSQEDTLDLPSGRINAQIRLLTNSGAALATDVVIIDINDVLKGGVIE